MNGRGGRAQRKISLFIACAVAIGGHSAAASAAGADGIARLLDAIKVPIPTRRPSNLIAFEEEQAAPALDNAAVGSVTALARKADEAAGGAVAGSQLAPVAAIDGTFKKGLDALSAKDAATARGILESLPAGSIERKTLSWAIALSGLSGIPSAEIAKIAAELSEWPGQRTMRINAEAALASEPASPQTIIAAFAGRQPESVSGGIALARAYLAIGDRKAANRAIREFWRKDRLLPSTEKRILSQAGDALTREDHRFRTMALLYRERAKDGLRMAPLAGLEELAKAWAAVLRDEKNAAALLDALPSDQKATSGYLFARAKLARKSDAPKLAAQYIDKAPKDAESLVDPDEWWVERRLVSRALLDAGDPLAAYRLAAAHSAETPSVAAEAEFHAGWFALRFLKNPALAAKHFDRILQVSSTPISQARGYYWKAQALGPVAGAKSLAAAARYHTTYYGQLAAHQLGKRRLAINDPKPTNAQRATFSSRELVRAIALLEDAGERQRADIIYRDLAERLNNPAELAILAARAEKRGDRTLALQIGKIAHGRGLEVDSVSWPLGAIPANADIGTTGRALAYAIARQESAFNIAAVSPANARGLLQLLPGTAKEMAKKQGMKYDRKRLTTDAAYNATLGSAYLSQQLDTFGNSYILTFAGYNAGPGRVRQWIDTYGDPRGKPIADVIDWIERIPFTETRNYVQRVMENYQVYKARIGVSRFDIEFDLRFGRR
jgi:soluble lytic murein transglycosylase